MDDRAEAAWFWPEGGDKQWNPLVSLKRKARTRGLEFVGWGSRQLIEFLKSIGKDTCRPICQHEVVDIINKYVQQNNLHHAVNKKRIVCDDRLHSLFGKKTIRRIKIYEMLEVHYAENIEGSDDDFWYSSEDEQQERVSSTIKHNQKKKVVETTKSCYAAIVPDNIKLVYLKRSLVQGLLRDPDTFEAKIVGSFVKIKSDPSDYLQTNSHLLVQVTGLKEASRTDDILLQVSNFAKEIHICMLSDDNLSQEECEDLHQRVKDGLLKRPTVVELTEKAQSLHEDVTKHWLAEQLTSLQRLIDRANEKGWRKDLSEYLERRQLLQTPEEQSRLLHEIPEVIADEVELEAAPQDLLKNVEQGSDGSPISIIPQASELTICYTTGNGTLSPRMSFGKDSAEDQGNVRLHKEPKQSAQRAKATCRDH